MAHQSVRSAIPMQYVALALRRVPHIFWTYIYIYIYMYTCASQFQLYLLVWSSLHSPNYICEYQCLSFVYLVLVCSVVFRSKLTCIIGHTALAMPRGVAREARETVEGLVISTTGTGQYNMWDTLCGRVPDV